MKILSLNVNGLRAAYKKGFVKWLQDSGADVVCLQEVKAHSEQLPADLINPCGLYSYFNCAEKSGYSGVVVYTKEKPLRVTKELGLKRFDIEGRFLELIFSDFVLVAVYMPHGGRQKENLEYKLEAYRMLLLRARGGFKGKNVIIIGDFNIAHKDIDLARPQQNRNNIMFTTEERQQIDALLGLGFIDSFRRFCKGNGYYTWWPYAFNARGRNLGWRIDYGFVSSKSEDKLKDAFILDKVQMSDHCPIGLEL